MRRQGWLICLALGLLLFWLMWGEHSPMSLEEPRKRSCGSSVKSLWFSIAIELNPNALPSSVTLKETTYGPVRTQVPNAAETVYILGPLTQKERELKATFLQYRENTRREFAPGSEELKVRLRKVDEVLAAADLDTPLERSTGLVRRFKFENGSLLVSNASQSRRWEDTGAVMQMLVVLRDLGIEVDQRQGPDRPVGILVPPKQMFQLKLLDRERVAEVPGSITYGLNPDYQPCPPILEK